MRLLSVLLAICSASVAVVACGGGGGDRLSDEEYFARVGLLLKAADAAISADEVSAPTGVGTEDLLLRHADQFEFVGETYRRLSERLLALNPGSPVDLAELNDDFAQAMREHSESFVLLAGSLRGEQQDVFALDVLPSRTERVEALCLELQQAASVREIDAGLSCAIRSIAVFDSA